MWITSGKRGKGQRIKGESALRIRKDGYLQVSINGKIVMAHRAAWILHHGAIPVGEIDHLDGNKHNNRIANLRVVDRVTNQQNMRTPPRHNKTGVLGVSVNTSGIKPYRVTIGANKKKHYIGRFWTLEEAKSAYIAAKRKLHAGCTI